MATGFRNASGTDFDNLFDFYQTGAKPSATGLRTSDGVDLNQRYAPIALGSKGPNVGFRISSGVDVSNLWAAKGTSNTSLPIDGNTYSSDSQQRGSASLTFNMNSDGSYSVVRFSTQTGTATLASGTWLPSGDSASSYTCQYIYTVNSASTPGGGSNAVSNGAISQSALTANRALVVTSSAPLTGNNADQNVTVVMKLYKSGVLRSTTTVTFATNVNGF